MENKTKCYCNHTDYCDCAPLEELKQETLEEVRMVKRTELYNSILSIVKQLPRKEVQDDAMDAPSCTYELEQLFLKWQQEQNKNLYSEEEVHKILGSYSANKEFFSYKYTYNKWFEQFKKK